MRAAAVLLLVLGLFACASTPLLRVQQTNEPMGHRPAAPFQVGTCAATVRVRVVDAQGRAVVGAEVVAMRVISNRAPSMVPSVDRYRSQPVMTDARGEARVCDPDGLHDIGPYDFATVRKSVIEARRGTEVGTIAAPFDGAIILGPPGILDL